MSFNRSNIKYQIIQKKGKHATEEIIQLIKKKFNKKSGIIYCLARKDCEILADQLNGSGIKTRPYHAGDKIREAIQREWMQDRFFVIVATIAFGMGIDKPDVRFVIHHSIPKSVEAFYQEPGRAVNVKRPDGICIGLVVESRSTNFYLNILGRLFVTKVLISVRPKTCEKLTKNHRVNF